MCTWIRQRLSEKPSVFREKEPHPCFPDGEGDGENAAARARGRPLPRRPAGKALSLREPPSGASGFLPRHSVS